jgi:hypothetical protein
MNLTRRPIYQKGLKSSRRRTPEEIEDAEYLEWVRRQASCISGQYSEYVNGEGRCIAAHHRTAANSGIAVKPLLSALPMTNDEHLYQHRHGARGIATKDGWNKLVAIYVARWRRERERNQTKEKVHG